MAGCRKNRFPRVGSSKGMAEDRGEHLGLCRQPGRDTLSPAESKDFFVCAAINHHTTKIDECAAHPLVGE